MLWRDRTHRPLWCCVKVVGLDPSWNGQGTADKLAACLLEVYTALQSAFSPSQHPHYIFTPRHLSLWASGLQNYSLHATDLLQVGTLCLSVYLSVYCWAYFCLHRKFSGPDTEAYPRVAAFDAVNSNAMPDSLNPESMLYGAVSLSEAMQCQHRSRN